MKSRRILRWIAAVTLLPLVLLGLYVLIMRIHGLVRYDPAYFAGSYLEEYGSPGVVARALESALQTGDEELLAELQGRRRPSSFATSPDTIFVMVWESTDRYVTYLYVDMSTYERHLHYVEQVKGRWIVSAPDMYFYMRSGRWLAVYFPAALTWWALEIVALVAIWLYRFSARMQQQMYGG